MTIAARTTTAQTTVFRRTASGFDRTWDRIVRAQPLESAPQTPLYTTRGGAERWPNTMQCMRKRAYELLLVLLKQQGAGG